MKEREKHKPIYISWATDCSRSDSIAKKLGGKSYMVYSPAWGSRYSTIIFKYISQTWKTLRILLRERPSFVFVMSPPVIACFPVWLYTRLTGGAYAIDAHTAAFLQPRWQSVIFLHRFFSRRARTTIVTNDYLKNIVESWNAPSTIVTDVPVDFGKANGWTRTGKVTMTLVSTFTEDEPLPIFLRAAARLPHIQFYVTGDYSTADPAVLKERPPNVEFTGFLPKGDYVGLLQGSDAVICLTTLDHAMQRGAYEAVYLGKPVVTSNFEVLRKSFAKGTVHVDGSVEDIVNGILKMQSDLPRYEKEVLQLRTEKLNRWQIVESELRQLILSGAR